jgi:glutamine amidotransferase
MSRARIGIVGYGMGNIMSLQNAFEAVGTDCFVAQTAAALAEASHIVLPGVGAFPRGMERLRAQGFDEAIHRLTSEEGRPLLGICLGMQLLASEGEEHEVTRGLGLIPGRVVRLSTPGLRVPHVGWNETRVLGESRLLDRGPAEPCFYYVHSYHLQPDRSSHATLGCVYGEAFVAGVEHEQVMGVQFHPEKSHGAGLALLKRFAGTGVTAAVR